MTSSEKRYRGLFETLDEACCIIQMVFDGAERPVDYVVLEANAAFERQTGSGVGAFAAHWLEIVGRIARTGKAERFEHQAAGDRWYSVLAFRVGEPELHRVAVLFSDIGELKQRELEVALLNEIGKDLAQRSDPEEIMQAVGARVSEHLRVSRCLIADVDEGTLWQVEPGRAMKKQILRVHDDAFARAHRAGETFVVHDTARDEQVHDEPAGASVSVPFLVGGRWRGYLAVTHHAPRAWRANEIALLEEVAERLLTRVERTRTEAALRDIEVQRRLMTDLVPALLWWADPEKAAITVAESWRSYTGQGEIETEDSGWLGAIHPDDRESTQAAFARAFATGEPLECQQRIHRAGSGFRWHIVRHVPVRDPGGAITRWFGAAIDVEDLRRLQDRQKVLVAELQHRTRNLIAVIGSIAQQTMERTGSTEAFRAAFDDRLGALSRVQGLLFRASETPITIDQLLRMELDALGVDEVADRITLHGPEVALRNSVVQTLALAVHELATNARKHGALATDHGRLKVTWNVRAGRLALEWLEQGVDGQQSSSGGGYGRELIERALPYAHGAKTSYQLEGHIVRCTIELPLDEVTV